MEDWLERSWEFQQQLYNQLGDRMYDELKGTYELVEKLKVAFCYCYGDNYNCDEKKTEITEKVTSTALKFFNEGYSAYFFCTFINLQMTSDKTEAVSCVFWLYHTHHEYIILDLNCRSYISWIDFLKNNKLPKCYMMYPKDGVYHCNRRVDFKEITLEESIACSFKSLLMDRADVATTIGSFVGTGILIFNPVSAPLVLGAAVVTGLSGVYCAGRSMDKLMDIHYHHGGLSATDSKTLFAMGELVISGVGLVAIGAANGIKGAAGMKALSEGSFLCKIANNASEITKIVCGVNAAFSVVVLTEKYIREGNLNGSDIFKFGQILLFGLNIFVTPKLLYDTIKCIASKFSVQDLTEYAIKSPRKVGQVVKRFYKFISENQLENLINTIFPNLEPARVIKPYLEKISNIVPIVDIVRNIVCRVDKTLKNKKFDIDLIYFLQKDFIALWSEIKRYKNKNSIEIEKKFGKNIQCVIEKWTKNDPIDLCSTQFDSKLNNTHSDYDYKINSPMQFNKQIEKTVDICCRHLNMEIEIMINQEKKLCSETILIKLLKLVNFHDFKSHPMYLPTKINYYCELFLSLYRTLIQRYHFEYFLHVESKNKCITKDDFFCKYYSVTSIYKHAFDLAFKNLEKNLQSYHEDFEANFVNERPTEDQRKYIFEFEIPAKDFSKENLYCKAKLLRPNLKGQLTDDLTTCDFFDDLCIIKSKEDKFILFFCVIEETKIHEENYKNGCLLVIESL